METSQNHGKEVKKLKTLRAGRWMLSVLGLVVIVYGLYLVLDTFFNYSHNETTNDAQIEQYISPVNVRVPGYIKKINFTEYQFVHKGDTLLVVEDREYKIRLMEAQAALKDASSGKEVIGNSLNTSKSNASVFDASIQEAEVRIEKLKRDYNRYTNLLERKAATPIQVDQIKTELDMAQARLAALKQQKKTAYSSVKEVTERQGNAEAAIMRATAAKEMAELNLSYTVVLAPCDGYLGRRTLEERQLVNAGQTVTYIIPNTPKWVIANYKEKQIEHLSVGQKVRISVDAIHDKEFTGRITEISKATGSKYSLIPTDNSAGNFVKIQQRVPVRIAFENLSKEDNEKLSAGMMAIVSTQKD